MKFLRNNSISIFLLSIFLLACGSNPNEVEKVKYPSIDRTLSLLNNSTEDNRNNVEILFYGQSIIGGMKTNILVDSLQAMFPFANISFKHKPIGGFTIPDLTRTVTHDVYQENPDLIIFHAYGGIRNGLYDEFIKNIRNKLSSDILILDHHYVWDKPESKLNTINKSHDFDSKVIQEIAEKYNCGFVNVREQWRDYLNANNIKANELMGNATDPNVHPNDKGNKLLRQIVLSEFKSENYLDYSIPKDSLRDSISITKNKEINTFKFRGNRLELFVNPTNEAAVIELKIDGKTPSEFRNMYHITRPSKGFNSWMPLLKNVSLGSAFPRQEDWTLFVYDIDRQTRKFKFRIEGSATGPDGEGNSEADFISNSNRISIKKEGFHLFQIEKIVKKETPENYQISFSIELLVQDHINLIKDQSKYLLYRDFDINSHEVSLKIISGFPEIENLVVSRSFIN